MDQLLKMQKRSAQQRLPGGIGHFEWIRGRKIRRNPANFLRIRSGMRCGASGELKIGVWSVFQPYRHFIRVKSYPQWPFNFGGARENPEFPGSRSGPPPVPSPVSSYPARQGAATRQYYCFIIEAVVDQ
jgi:hypothetical protein